MAPKDKRSRASTSRNQEDAPELTISVASTFRNAEAKARYDKWTSSNKTTIMEIIFEPDQTDGDICKEIDNRGWKHLCEVPSAGCIALVREFYANLDWNAQESTVVVRGKSVSFAPPVINAHYRTPNINPNQHGEWSRGNIDYERIIRDLCPPGFKWTYGSDRQTIINLSSAGLSIIAKAWNRFIMSVLNPSTNQSELPLDRVRLLHSICSGRSINVGEIICQSMRHTASQATTGGLGHAALITQLCRKAGVQFSQYEPSVQPQHFTHNNIVRMSQWAGGRENPSGLGFLPQAQEVPVPAPVVHRRRHHGAYGDQRGHELDISIRAQERAARRQAQREAASSQPSSSQPSSSSPHDPQPSSSSYQMGDMMALLEQIQRGQVQLQSSMDQGFQRVDRQFERSNRRIESVERRQIDLAHWVTQCTSMAFHHSGIGDLPPAPDTIWQPYASPPYEPQPPPDADHNDEQ